MKKKILFVALMVSLLACLFAIGVSAEGFTSGFTSEVTKFYAVDGTTELKPDWVDP